jgi:enoyl-CoA hydratase/carnithine racemase
VLKYSYRRLLLVDGGDHVLRLVMNRPEQLNAVDELMHRELAAVFPRIAADRKIRVVVLTGAGRAFSAGGDLDWLGRLSELDAYRKVMREGFAIISGIVNLPQPVIAAINGPAVGLAANMALFADLSIMAESAYLADPHVPNVGVVAGDGGAVIWPLLVGHARAKRYLFSGERVAARTAEQIGLVTMAVADQQFEEKVVEWSRRLSTGPTTAIQLTKQMINRQLNHAIQQTLEASLAVEGLSFHSADHHEALSAMRARRKPAFRGD